MGFQEHKKYVMFPGRWQPFHDGHLAIMRKALDLGKNICIAIRDTEISDSNPYSVKQRREMIKRAFGEDLYGSRVIDIVIPDIEGIWYGRGVGYEVKEIDVDKAIKEISATKIRDGSDNRTNKRIFEYINNLNSTFWFTGRPCAGKSTLVKKLGEVLENSDMGYRVSYIDGDEVRRGLCHDLGFSEEDRKENMRRVAYMAKGFNENKNTVLASFVSPTNNMRDIVKRILGDGMKLIYVDAPLWVCEKRDTKGMYAEARLGKRPGFTGIDQNAPFEEPDNPDFVVDTEHTNVDECVKSIVKRFDL